MKIDELIKEALGVHTFREKRADENYTEYLAALIAHVEAHDFAAAHELRVGRRQKDWTPGDVADFRSRMIAHYQREGAPPPTRPSIHLSPLLELVRLRGPIDEAALLTVAESGMHFFQQMRRRKPRESTLPIIVNALTTDGRVLVSHVIDRGDRVETVRSIVAVLPVFGFFVLCDVFVHAISADNDPRQTASKVDALIAHVGTRDMRKLITRPYHYGDDGLAVFHEAPPDIDKRGRDTLNDPYADVFATPGPSRVQ